MNRSIAPLWMIISVAILFAFGLLMVFNTSAAQIIDRSLETSIYMPLFKQILYAGVGLALGALVYWRGYEALLRHSTFLLVVATLLLVLVFVPGIGQSIHGARRWLFFEGFSFQPSECVKILLPAAFLQWALRQEAPISFARFAKVLGWLTIPIVLILLEPDNGTTAILLSLLVILFILVRIRWRYWALPLFTFLVVGACLAYRMPHVPDRIRIYLHPELDLQGKGHQPHQAKIAAGSGQLFGRGLGESLQKLNYLPEARSDYIAAIFAEEMGFLGILGLVSLYVSFAYAGFAIALRAPTRAAFLFAVILTFLISIQAFLNLGIVSGLLPSKGMTLPFFSQGGTSLMVNFIALFLLLDIARKSNVEFEYEG